MTEPEVYHRWFSHRCSRMSEHMYKSLPEPCDKCFVIEHISRRAPWVPKSQQLYDNGTDVRIEILPEEETDEQTG